MGMFSMKLQNYIFVFIIGVLSGISCEDYNDVLNLTNTLLQGYYKSIIPKRNQSETIKLEMEFSLKALNKFDVVDGQMTMVTAIALKWQDDLLSWDPQSNKNIHILNIPLSKIWSPNFYLLNCAEEFLIYKGDPDTKEVVFSSSGQARLFFMEVLTTTCTSNIAFYPNDLHLCKIYLSTLSSASKLRMGLAEVDIVDFETNGEWMLGEIKSEVEFLESKNIERVVITIALERRMMFHMINVVSPVVFLGLVNVIVFKLPVESGERISFAMTVLLSFAVYMTLIADKMPQTSNTTSVFCMYLMAMLTYSTLITFATTYSINRYHSRHNTKSKYVNKIQEAWISLKKTNPKKTTKTSVEELNLPPLDMVRKNSTMSQNVEISGEDKAERIEKIDRTFFGFFAVYFVVATSVLFVLVLSR
ncbi:acetylcholine receptor subunit delta-like [Ostrea edulis]|uniref:acetylcholine receptor subunit delta-like n=1 Tax=Ostrea edulis TaxID=37623 RepID=UPI0024AEC0F8|nr:acetylcholine receptor subunit delta-like [Ostrea edulis]